MQEAQENLKRAAVAFLEAAQAAAREAAASDGQAADQDAGDAGPLPAAGAAAPSRPQTDPLDGVGTTLFDLGDLQPAITPEELSVLKRTLAAGRLAPATVLELVGLARQVAAVLGGA
ncbi:MAG: hypothetical protein FJ288_20085 [Planctomycetes bacterium]|nr:hypothetical protein [Planctomycetota bacterium]